jgi:hypothetical protein
MSAARPIEYAGKSASSNVVFICPSGIVRLNRTVEGQSKAPAGNRGPGFSILEPTVVGT